MTIAHCIGIGTLFLMVSVHAASQTDEELIRQGRELIQKNQAAMDQATSGGYATPTLNVERGSPLLQQNQFLPEARKDFMDLATGKKSLAQVATKKYDFMIFVSFSMPDEILRLYSTQAKEYGAKLVLRGMFENSLTKTKLRGLEVNAAGAEWDIAPATFRKFKIERVPAIVIADATNESVLENGCAKAGDYIRVDGDISLHQALVLMKQQGEGRFVKVAEDFLETENH
ncbi:MAG: type-F conjugative transfer system pilin assembly protein TrbC [Sideroxydans sp.]|nr:type-F conjugative transfer system pilin assembly protein TrbC [Sideroxydans sp.]MDD5056647.1 type-F conjugative transfer system pilin assembly protein TrbC [Sideroxydans sp.]